MLRKLNAEGLSCCQVGAAVSAKYGRKRSRCAVIGRLRRIGVVTRPSLSTSERNDAKRHYGEVAKAKREAKPFKIEPRAVKPPVVLTPPLVLAPVTPTASMPRCVELRPHGCKWPVGEVRRGCGDEQQFCGEAKLPGWPYCGHHHEIAYRKIA